jgi:hypothetical protein
MNLDDYHIAGAPFGGPLALIRDDKKLVALSGDNAKSKLRIYTTAGNKIAEVLSPNFYFIQNSLNQIIHI